MARKRSGVRPSPRLREGLKKIALRALRPVLKRQPGLVPIPQTKSRYGATPDGKIWRLKAGPGVSSKRRLPYALSEFINKFGCPCVSIKGRPCPIENLIARAFLGERWGDWWVDHKDGDPRNCASGNLEWCPGSRPRKGEPSSELMRSQGRVIRALARKASIPDSVLAHALNVSEKLVASTRAACIERHRSK